MKLRIVSTLILWALAIGMPMAFGKYGVFMVVIPFAMGTAFEVAALLKRTRLTPSQSIALPATLVCLLALALLPPWVIPPLTLFALTFACMAIATLLLAPLGGFVPQITANSFLFFLVSLPFGIIIILTQEMGIAITLWVVAVAKFTDVGALLIGTWLGKHRMAPALSPKKTWEGLVGGFAFSVLASCAFVFLFDDFLPMELSPLHAAWMALPIAIAAVFSDLAESAIKREAGVKDSGNLIPGIGGCFDLTDSFILAYPVAYCLIWLVS